MTNTLVDCLLQEIILLGFLGIVTHSSLAGKFLNQLKWDRIVGVFVLAQLYIK